MTDEDNITEATHAVATDDAEHPPAETAEHGAAAPPPETPEAPHAEGGGDDHGDEHVTAGAATEAAAAAPTHNKKWYVVKVQSGREESIKNAIERRVKIDGLEEYFGRILIPTEKVTELRNGKRVVKKRKKFPGYLMVEVEFNDKILYLFRETSGVGDFVGGSLHKVPPPMTDREVERMLADQDERTKDGEEKKREKVLIPYGVGDRVKVRDGTFAGMEGEVKDIVYPADPKEHPKVKVVLTIWGRPVDVDVEYWQVEQV